MQKISRLPAHLFKNLKVPVFVGAARGKNVVFLMSSHEFAVVNCINHILSCGTTKLKNFSTPHGEILDPPLQLFNTAVAQLFTC